LLIKGFFAIKISPHWNYSSTCIIFSWKTRHKAL
jgi:hypothetical protein